MEKYYIECTKLNLWTFDNRHNDAVIRKPVWFYLTNYNLSNFLQNLLYEPIYTYMVPKYISDIQVLKEINHKLKTEYQIREGQQCVKCELKSCFFEIFVFKTTESFITQDYKTVILL